MKITDVIAHPLTMPIAAGQHRTHWGDYPSVSMLVVEIVTDDGVIGFGEGLVRLCPESYALMVQNLLRSALLGRDPFHVEKIWQDLVGRFHSKVGHMVLEAVAAIDIALWDIMGRATGRPIHHLLGSMGRKRVEVYASSISWDAEEVALAQTREAVQRGFPMLKLKLGNPVERALKWAARLRAEVGDSIRLCADANGAYDLDDAIAVARGLHELGFYWLEEPIDPNDFAGYGLLRQASPMRIAAGESELLAVRARELISSRSIGVFQPDCTRSSGITETRKMVSLAHNFNIPYAPHLGAGGAIAAAANLQLAAAAPNFLIFECMIFPSPLRDELATTRPADPNDLQDGTIPIPIGPGLGIEINRDTLAKYRTGFSR
jgi:L-alanine-DL-glutamate epimerase-like enolase superfamily enzyme